MNLQQNVQLAPFTTFQIGGPARYYIKVSSAEELKQALVHARSQELPTFLMGGGSNLLVADAGFDGLVIHLALTPSIKVDQNFVEASAGTDWNALVRHTCDLGLSGIECLAGIPGLTGASPIQNIGAYGQEVAQTIEVVSALDLQTLKPVTLSREDCRFAYRSSIFKTNQGKRYAITAVRFRLSYTPARLTYADLTRRFGDSRPTPAQTAAAVREIRLSKGMIVVPDDPDSRSAGSFFTNPVVPLRLLERLATLPPNWPVDDRTTKLSAAWLLEQAGFHRGFALGEAGISSRHTLALINRTGRASCADILRLRDTISGEVQARFNVRLEQEPVHLQ